MNIRASEIYKNTRLSLQVARRRGDLDVINTQQKKQARGLNRMKNRDRLFL